MKQAELYKIVEVIKNTYNGIVDEIHTQVEPSTSMLQAIKILGQKEGAEMAMIGILHALLSCYGIEIEMEISDGRKLSLGGKNGPTVKDN